MLLRIFYNIFNLRQVDLEYRAPSMLAGDLDLAAALFDDPLDGGQAQSGTLAGRLGGKEGIENMSQGFRIHAQAVVGH